MLRRLKLWLGPLPGFLILRCLWASYRVRLDEATVARLSEIPTPSIFAFWHDQTFVGSAFLVRRVLAEGRNLAVLISPSDDGELVARTVGKLGITVVRGSASRHGAQGLRALYREVVKHSSSPVLLPDGPRGPAYQVKPGVVVLAQMTGAPILVLAFRVDRAWTLRSWDLMRVPKPFARIDVRASDLQYVPRTLSDEDRATRCRDLAATLSTLRSSIDPTFDRQDS